MGFSGSRAGIFFFGLNMMLLAVCMIQTAGAQVKKIGLPFAFNYSKTTYTAGTQNWSITQSSKGFIYFGNNDGLLEFDGQNWKTYPLPARSVLRSVFAVGDTIYAGAFEEIGFYAPGKTNRLEFHSLTSLIPKPYKAFDEIWKIYKTRDGIVFQSFRYIFLYQNGKIIVLKPRNSFLYSFLVRDRLLVVDKNNGLFEASVSGLKLISNHPLFLQDEVRCILEKGPDELIIGTFNHGLYLYKDQKITQWQTPLTQLLKENVLFSGINLKSGFYAFGTIRNGLYIVDNLGIIYQHINRQKGLQNNTILSLFEDKHKDLWLGLDNGIDFVELNSPLSIFNYNYNIESTYCSVVFNGRLYAGTNQGLYTIELDKLSNQNLNPRFELIKGTEGQVWSLSKVGNQLFCGHNYGCFLINGAEAERISDITGFWNFTPYHKSADTLICGTYNGIYLLIRNRGSWSISNQISGFTESCRTIKQDKDGSLWIAHGYRGLFHITVSRDLHSVQSVKLFNKGYGLPDEFPYNVNKINNEILISTRTGFYAFSNARNEFVPQGNFNEIFKDQPYISEITKDESGNFWYFSLNKVGVYRLLEDGSYSDVEIPFYPINNTLIPAFENINIYDSRNIFIGSQNGLIHYDPEFPIDYRLSEPAYIREVKLGPEGESRSVFYPAEQVSDTTKRADSHNVIVVPYKQNSVVFSFTSPCYESRNATLFSFRLTGFEKKWSDWDKSNYKEYTNLGEGIYTFEVKAMNAYKAIGPVSSFTFRIDPPFYRSTIAYAIYTVFFILVFIGNIYFQKKKIEKTRANELLKHEKDLEEQSQFFREQSLIQEKEIINLRNETLMNEMSHKNKELANSTLNLIHKNKILTNLKNHLTELMQKPHDTAQQKHELSLLIKKINRELSSEKHQEAFDSYFDEVHQDFILRLKEVYPNLSPKELRLCAYLKMNLSSKEIAPLMNISVRGLEISRYRLRKKLNLERNVNLIDFILSF